jgi:hypothetical protein
MIVRCDMKTMKTMKTQCGAADSLPERTGRDERGVALLGILLFAVVVGLTGLAFFAMASYEFKSAKDRQESSEAFYLADGAIERARGELLVDKSWRGPVASTALGSGTYTLSAVDTVYNGFPAVLLHGEGFVGDGARGVEIFGGVKDLLETVAIHASRNIIANGNLNVDGHIHVNGDGYFGPDDDHLKSGTYDEGYEVNPPAIHVHPDNFPESTCYRVVVKNGEGEVRKWDRTSRNYKKVGTAPPIPVKGGPDVYDYKFSAEQTTQWFNQRPGTPNAVFTRDPGDSSVVVDFGHPDDTPPGSIANLDFQQNDPVPFETTIINTQFVGISEADRIAPCSSFWKGGNVTFGSKMTWVPRNCVALVTNHLGPPQGQQPNAQGSLGTLDNPALTYVTGNVEGIKGQLQIYGVLVSLCDINSQGGPDVWHDPSILDCIPDGVLSEDGSGFLHVLEWREAGL